MGKQAIDLYYKYIMMDINERQDQTFTSKSNIYVCDNNGCNLYLLGVNALVFKEPVKQGWG